MSVSATVRKEDSTCVERMAIGEFRRLFSDPAHPVVEEVIAGQTFICPSASVLPQVRDLISLFRMASHSFSRHEDDSSSPLKKLLEKPFETPFEFHLSALPKGEFCFKLSTPSYFRMFCAMSACLLTACNFRFVSFRALELCEGSAASSDYVKFASAVQKHTEDRGKSEPAIQPEKHVNVDRSGFDHFLEEFLHNYLSSSVLTLTYSSET